MQGYPILKFNIQDTSSDWQQLNTNLNLLLLQILWNQKKVTQKSGIKHVKWNQQQFIFEKLKWRKIRRNFQLDFPSQHEISEEAIGWTMINRKKSTIGQSQK